MEAGRLLCGASGENSQPCTGLGKTENVTPRSEKKRASDSPQSPAKGHFRGAVSSCSLPSGAVRSSTHLLPLISDFYSRGAGGRTRPPRQTPTQSAETARCQQQQKEGALRAGLSQPLTLLRASTQDLWKKSLEVTSDPLQHQARTQMALQLDVQPAGLPGSLL